MPIETKAYYAKLAAGEPLSKNEVLDLLQSYETAQKGLAYLASCQAATLESLPASTSKSSRSRHVNITKMAGEFVAGNLMSLRHPTNPADAVLRCQDAVKAHAAPASK